MQGNLFLNRFQSIIISILFLCGSFPTFFSGYSKVPSQLSVDSYLLTFDWQILFSMQKLFRYFMNIFQILIVTYPLGPNYSFVHQFHLIHQFSIRIHVRKFAVTQAKKLLHLICRLYLFTTNYSTFKQSLQPNKKKYGLYNLSRGYKKIIITPKG